MIRAHRSARCTFHLHSRHAATPRGSSQSSQVRFVCAFLARPSPYRERHDTYSDSSLLLDRVLLAVGESFFFLFSFVLAKYKLDAQLEQLVEVESTLIPNRRIAHGKRIQFLLASDRANTRGSKSAYTAASFLRKRSGKSSRAKRKERSAVYQPTNQTEERGMGLLWHF